MADEEDLDVGLLCEWKHVRGSRGPLDRSVKMESGGKAALALNGGPIVFALGNPFARDSEKPYANLLPLAAFRTCESDSTYHPSQSIGDDGKEEIHRRKQAATASFSMS